MQKTQFTALENYMLACMEDSAHDAQHIYRVLGIALDIAAHEADTDMDVLIAACLLHDIGRKAQAENPALCHAKVGSEMAYQHLLSLGWEPGRAAHVQSCIQSHRYRAKAVPQTTEAKILFDADTLEAAGAMGVARTLLYKGQFAQPLYITDSDGKLRIDANKDTSSFFHEYHYKLERIYDRFYTKRGRELAQTRRKAAEQFYENLRTEIEMASAIGLSELEKHLR